MINLDTNVLLRLLVADDAVQTAKVREFMAKLSPQRQAHISLVVLAEVMGVLARFYKQSRSQLARYAELLLNTAELHLEQADLVRDTIAAFRQSTAGFIDCLIEQQGVAAHCEYTLTFHRDAARTAGMRLL